MRGFGFEQSHRLPYAGMLRFLNEAFLEKKPDTAMPDLRGRDAGPIPDTEPVPVQPS